MRYSRSTAHGDAFQPAVEMGSTETPMLQVADLAEGYARDRYLEFGLRVVCEEFRAVILNGTMVRDWTQVHRLDIAELKRR